MPKFVNFHLADDKAVVVRIDADAIQYYKDSGTTAAPAFATTLSFYGNDALMVAETPEEVDSLIADVCGN